MDNVQSITIRSVLIQSIEIGKVDFIKSIAISRPTFFRDVNYNELLLSAFRSSSVTSRRCNRIFAAECSTGEPSGVQLFT